MKNTVPENTFIHDFLEIRPDNFSRNGLKTLYRYFTELEDECETDFEFDVIGICCDYAEYEDISEYNKDYNDEYEDRDELERSGSHGTFVPVGQDGFIVDCI